LKHKALLSGHGGRSVFVSSGRFAAGTDFARQYEAFQCLLSFPVVEAFAHAAGHEEAFHWPFAAQDLDLDIPGFGCGVARAHAENLGFFCGWLVAGKSWPFLVSKMDGGIFSFQGALPSE
jgi:hypothetical protein